MSLPTSRREFLKRVGALSVSGAAAPLALNLAALGEAAAAGADDYKALVCVFLYGGNDHANTLVPYDDDSYKLYHAQRPRIAIEHELLAQTRLRNPVTPLPGNRAFALNPALKPLVPLFAAGQMAVMLNIGTLVRPTSKDDYLKRLSLPPKLFSHNDQQACYQALGPEGSVSGWGGRMGDGYAANHSHPTFTNLSLSGSAVFAAGQTTGAYQVSAALGAVAVRAIKQPLFGSATCSQVLRELVTAPQANLFQQAHARIMGNSLAAEELLTPALADVLPRTTFPTTTLGAQLSMVARMILARAALVGSGAPPKRQVFFVSLGGFDTHDGIGEVHGPLLAEVAGALSAFQSEMNDRGLANSVTTFTASDFGRTLNSDGDGSDHGWGSYHFVLGGDVNGRDFYGEAPDLTPGGDNDVGRGRMLPRVSVDQFAARLGSWFGVPPAELDGILPNLKNFSDDKLKLDFMKTPLAA